MTLPLYRAASCKPPGSGQGDYAHAGLWFDKFCDTWTAEWSMSGGGATNPKLAWIETVSKRPVGKRDQIEEFAARHALLAQRLGGRALVFTAESRFVTGLGRSHPVENGFAWHPSLGVPYLSGSSVKGMVRAWAEREADPRPESSTVDTLLGKPDRVGSLCFMDAVPIAPVHLEADVMTPHYGGWNPADPPGDWRSPNPVPFLVTPAGTSFLFGIAPLRAASNDHLELIESWLCDALEWAGAGAKTAVGYGRFFRDDERLADLERQREERLRQEREKRAREERLASMSPVEREIQEQLDNRQDPGMPSTTVIYQAIESGLWSGEQKREAARWLQAKMKSDGIWKESTKARKPQRDKSYRRTLQVIRWLNGE